MPDGCCIRLLEPKSKTAPREPLSTLRVKIKAPSNKTQGPPCLYLMVDVIFLVSRWFILCLRASLPLCCASYPSCSWSSSRGAVLYCPLPALPLKSVLRLAEATLCLPAMPSAGRGQDSCRSLLQTHSWSTSFASFWQMPVRVKTKSGDSSRSTLSIFHRIYENWENCHIKVSMGVKFISGFIGVLFSSLLALAFWFSSRWHSAANMQMCG